MSTAVMQQTIAEYFKTQPVLKAWLFGSFARGEETPLSDVDLLVQFDEGGVSLLKHATMICELEKILDNGKAYIAFDTPEELDAKRAEIENFQYDASTRLQMRNSLTLPKEEVDRLIAEGNQYVVRFLIEPKSGEVSSGYREKGYLPEAVVNFLALLGWNPGNDQEVMSLDEMVQLFDLSKCSKNGAKFDYIKAAWFNHQYLLKQPDEAWVPSFDKVLREQGITSTPEKEADVVRMMKLKVIEYTDGQGQKHKRNISFVSDLWPLTRFFFVAPSSFDAEDKFIRKNWKEGQTAQEMQQLADVLSGIEDFSIEGQKAVVDAWAAETGIKPWNAWRICLVGEGQGPDMYELSAFLGKDETLRRMKFAIETLG